MSTIITRRSYLGMLAFALVGSRTTGAQEAPLAAPAAVPSETSVQRWFLGIGNGQYNDERLGKLPKSPNDAQDIARSFADLRFNIDVQTDLKEREFSDAVIALADRVRQDDTVVFYFSGHGFQHDNDDFLVPVDSRFDSTARLVRDNVRVRWIMETIAMKQAATIVILLDACRSTPIISRNGHTMAFGQQRGMSGIIPRSAVLIGYATGPGEVAWTGHEDRRNSIYTHHLLQKIPTVDVEIEDVLKEVRLDVLHDTEQVQGPWKTDSLVGAVYLNPGAKVSELEEATWKDLNRAPTRESVLKFIARWPGGKHIPAARALLADISTAHAAPVLAVDPAGSRSVIDIAGTLSQSRIQDTFSTQAPLLETLRRSSAAVPSIGSARILQALPNRSATVFANRDRGSAIVASVGPVTPLDVTELPQTGTTGWARVRLPDGRNGFVDGVRVEERELRGITSAIVPFEANEVAVPPDQLPRINSILAEAARVAERQIRITAPPAPEGNLRVQGQLAFGRALALQRLALDAGIPQSRVQIDLPEEPGALRGVTVNIEEVSR